jgi:hypothetical protein
LAPSGPATIYVTSINDLVKWIRTDPGELISFRAIQGLANRSTPSIFMLQNQGPIHDQEWLDLLSQKYKARVFSKPDSTHHTDSLGWYIQMFRSSFAGYILFDVKNPQSQAASTFVALSLAGVLNAIPIDRNDSALLQTAKSAGLTQLEDVTNRDYNWLKGSKYWSQLNRNAIFFNQPKGLADGGDYAVALRMAVFWDDVRSDPQMSTMATMISDQNLGGIVFGWGYTDAQYREDVFVSVASRYTQSLLDTPANLSVYMHYPLQGALSRPAPPPPPTDLHKHYVAFVYSDGDNPRVILNELTKPGNDRYASPRRGGFPIGWTLPPTISSLAGPVVSAIYAAATPNDEFVAGPSGYGYAFPSLIPQKQVFGTQTQQAMARLGLHNVLVLDTSGATGFSHAALDPLTADANVSGVFFTAFNGRNQPPQGTVLWSNSKPVIPTVTLYRPTSDPNKTIANQTAGYLNSLSTDATSPAGYTVVYVDFWSVSMTDLSQIISRLGPNVSVVRPDVLTAMAEANIRH